MATISKKSSNIKPRRPLNIRMVQNFHLVWLDGQIDEENDNDCRNSIMQLRQVVNTVNTFTDVDECIDFITDINEEMVSIIVSDEFTQSIVPIVQEIPQIKSVYIFRENKAQPVKWAEQCFKVKGVFTNITTICEVLKHAVHEYEHNSVSISFANSTDTILKQNLDTIDQSFMYTQILKEILLIIDFDQSHIHEFLTNCRKELEGNTAQLARVDKIGKDYYHHQPIWWYSYESLFYSMVNRVLRLMEVDRIIQVGFFICDLHNHIAKLHTEQFGGQDNLGSFIVYRGQGLSHTVFDELKNNQGGLMSFNNFLSTSTDKAVSLAFAASSGDNPDMIGVLFEININPSILSSPFANIKNVSYYEEEEEILFSMHSVFRIGQMNQINENSRLYQVHLTLTSDTDPQLHALTKSIRKETEGSIGWRRLGILLLKLGYFKKAEELYEILLKQATDEYDKSYLYHHLGQVKSDQGNYVEAVKFYEKALEIKQKAPLENHVHLGSSYGNIGSVYYQMGEYSKALSYYQKALEIEQKTLHANHPSLAISYANIGATYNSIGEYSKALSYNEKALEIKQKSLPANHPDLATSYINIGLVYSNMGEYSKALSYYEKALEIKQKALPTNHPSLATTYQNVGALYDNMGEYSKALLYYEKTLEIFQKALPENHPNLANFYINIGLVYNKMEKYSKTLLYYEKAVEIIQKTSPANHPALATSYNNIGGVYNDMGEHSKALSYFQKALEIEQKTLPANHPSLANSYHNIGGVYNSIGEHSKAFSYYEKALEIFRPVNHPHLAFSYNNIGVLYHKTREYSKALSYYEKALEIRQRTLPANQPDLANSYNNIAGLYDNMGDYSKAVSFYQKALEILQKILPTNHPHLIDTYSSIGGLYYDMGEYSKALSYYEKTLEMVQKIVPVNHLGLATCYNNLGRVYKSKGDYSKALSYFEHTLVIRQHSLPPNHPDLESVKRSIDIIKKNV